MQLRSMQSRLKRSAGDSLEGRAAVLGFLRFADREVGTEVHVIVPGRAHRRAPQSAHRSHVSDNLPHLLITEFPLEAGHSVRTAFDNRVVDLSGIASVNPLVIYQRRSNSSAAVEVTSNTIHRVEQRLSFGKRIRIVLVRNRCALGMN